ncbi:hypothetical protein HYY75_03630 [bacterium]|nr:hypothetical protein [bacterium]
MKSKIVVTGIGLITPYGQGIDPMIKAISDSRVAYSEINEFDCSTWPVKVGGIIPETSIEKLDKSHNKLRGMGKYVKLGVLCARKALSDASIDVGAFPSERIGAFIASGTNGHNAEGLFGAFDFSRGIGEMLDLEKLSQEGIDHVHPWWLLGTISNNLIFFVTHFLGIKGANTNSCNSAVSGAYALDRAIESLNSGEIDIALVGGADCPVNWQMISDLSGLGLLAHCDSKNAIPMRPFLPDSPGTVLSEGAAFLVLELASHASSRGKKGLVEISHVSMFGSFKDPIRPDPTGEETFRVMKNILSEIPGNEKVQLNASATALESWDSAEWKGIEAASKEIPMFVGSAKPWIGNTFSISFLVETVASIIAMKNSFGLNFPFPLTRDSNLSMSPKGALEHSWAINLGQCFGGNTAGVLLHDI